MTVQGAGAVYSDCILLTICCSLYPALFALTILAESPLALVTCYKQTIYLQSFAIWVLTLEYRFR